VASSHFLINLLFNVKIHKRLVVDFDMTTLVIKYAVRKEIRGKCKVLEMGIGTGALISIYNAKRNNSLAIGADISERRVNQSKYISKLNNVNEEFITSDLFENISGKYDYIIFNPPYVPSRKGLNLELERSRHLSDDGLSWDGGEDGMRIISSFLKGAPDYLFDNAKIILGVQALYITKEKIAECLKNKSLKIKYTYKIPFLTSVVYFIEKN